MRSVGQGEAQASVDYLLLFSGAATLALFVLLVRPGVNSRRWSGALDTRPEALMQSMLGVAIAALIFGVYFMPIAVIAIAVHEYGHVLAYRMIGHRDPKFMLMPLGGVAYSSDQYHSNRDMFFVAIMGPGFSLALMVIAIVAAELLRGVAIGSGFNTIFPAHYAITAAVWIGFLNAINLLPIYPLDGGRALQSIASVAGPRRMRSIMMTATLITTLLIGTIAIALKMWLLLILVIIGLVQAERSLSYAAALPAMRRRDAILCALVYLSTLVALGYLSRHTITAWGSAAFQILTGQYALS